jgi:hypothetical protein
MKKTIHVGDDYEVGYGKPPEHTRFKKGQSGNRRGRPKRPRECEDLQNLFIEELHKPVEIFINGKKKKMPVWRLVAKGLIKKAVASDRSSIMLLKHFTDFKLMSDARRAYEEENDRRTRDEIFKSVDTWRTRDPNAVAKKTSLPWETTSKPPRSRS